MRVAEAPLVQAVLVAFGLWVLLRLVDQTLPVLILFAIGVILAAAISPLVEAIRRPCFPPGGWRVPKGIAVLIVFLATAAILVVAGYVVGGLLVAELVSLANLLPGEATSLANQANDLARAAHLPADLVPSASQFSQEAQAIAAGAFGVAQAILAGIVNFVIQLVVVLTFAAFLVVRSDEVMAFWVHLFPVGHQEKARAITLRIGGQMGAWVLGQLAISTIAGTLGGIAAYLLGLPFPVLIGVTTGLFQLIPVLGTMTMTIPVFFLGLGQSLGHGILAAVVFFALAQLNGFVIWPTVTGRAVRLSPVVVVIAIPLGAALYGTVGAFLAIPFAVAVSIFADEVVLPWLHRVEGSTPARKSPVSDQEERAA